jgi:hypothetical protein
MFVLLTSLLPAITPPAAAGTALSAGDVAFVGVNTDGDDEFSFVLLKPITAGTVLYITDKGWNDGSGFFTVSGDGILKWTAASDMSAGAIVHIKTTINGVIESGSLAATPGTVIWEENIGDDTVISYTGDQLFIYQGTEESPTILAGAHWNVEAGTTDSNWDGSTSDTKLSALPDQLTNGVNAIWLYGSGPTEYDNFIYSGDTVEGSPAELRTAINNISNWDVDTTNTTAYTLNPFPKTFTVTAAAPTVTGISPSGGSPSGGTSVTITGTDLTGATAVKFGTTDASSYSVDSATQITATSPAGSVGTVHVTVTTASGTSATSSADQFTYNTAPTFVGETTTLAVGQDPRLRTSRVFCMSATRTARRR